MVVDMRRAEFSGNLRSRLKRTFLKWDCYAMKSQPNIDFYSVFERDGNLIHADGFLATISYHKGGSGYNPQTGSIEVPDRKSVVLSVVTNRRNAGLEISAWICGRMKVWMDGFEIGGPSGLEVYGYYEDAFRRCNEAKTKKEIREIIAENF